MPRDWEILKEAPPPSEEDERYHRENCKLLDRLRGFLQMLSDVFEVRYLQDLTVHERSEPAPHLHYFLIHLRVRLKTGEKDIRTLVATYDVRFNHIELTDHSYFPLASPIDFQPGDHYRLRQLFSVKRSGMDDRLHIFDFPRIDQLDQAANKK